MKYTILLLWFIVSFSGCLETEKKSIDNKPFTNTDACIFSEIAYCNNPQAQLDKYLPGWKLAWDVVSVNGNHTYITSHERQLVSAIRP